MFFFSEIQLKETSRALCPMEFKANPVIPYGSAGRPLRTGITSVVAMVTRLLCTADQWIEPPWATYGLALTDELLVNSRVP
jgi:hypothetical protein